MAQTQIAPSLGVTAPDDDYLVVALLSKSAQQIITSLLGEFSPQLDGVIWPMPAASLHSTLCQIIQPKPYAEDKAALYRNNYHHYEAVLEEVLSQIKPIEIVFNVIEVSPQAIIVRGEDGGVCNQIRAQLVEKFPLPKETKLPPDIVHSSIARFTKEVDLEEVRAVVEGRNINFTETVREFQLLRHTSPHLLRYEVKCRYMLT
jgi:hypothetical protein